MKIRRNLYALLLCAVLFAGNSLSVLAAPQAMPDGNVFDPEYYAQQYPDVAAAFGTNADMLYQHYLLCGKAEGRKPFADGVAAPGLIDGFDAAFYAAAYPDIVAALGSDPAVLYQHYLLCGKAEGRMPCAGFGAAIVRRQYVPAIEVTVSTQEEAYEALAGAFASHASTLVLHNGGKVSLYPLYDQIDYLIAPRVGIYDDCNSCGATASLATAGSRQTLRLELRYLSSVEEEMWLDQFVAGYVPALAGLSDYEKVKTIHDYLCGRITYDYNTVNGSGSQRSAFDGLAAGSGVCTSYALAFQRIAESCGLTSRVLTGTLNGGPHMWNAVLLDGQWYHLDCTWDDQAGGIIRNFFLVGQDTIRYPADYSIMLAPTGYR